MLREKGWERDMASMVAVLHCSEKTHFELRRSRCMS